MKKQSTVINLCERYPERFENKRNDFQINPVLESKIIDEAIRETILDLVYLISRKI